MKIHFQTHICSKPEFSNEVFEIAIMQNALSTRISIFFYTKNAKTYSIRLLHFSNTLMKVNDFASEYTQL